MNSACSVVHLLNGTQQDQPHKACVITPPVQVSSRILGAWRSWHLVGKGEDSHIYQNVPWCDVIPDILATPKVAKSNSNNLAEQIIHC